jgi:1-pyrroline-5-carboxylate dehydrogenase
MISVLLYHLKESRVTSKGISRRLLSSLPSWASCDPSLLGKSSEIYAVSNIVGGKFEQSKSKLVIINPMDKDAHPIFTIPDTQKDEIEPFIESLRQCPKSGMHNPLKNPERYVQYGEICRKVGETRRKILFP